VKRLLVIRAGAIGDFVLTLPLLEAIRRTWADAEVEILGYPWIAELAAGRRLAAGARRIDAMEWAPLFARGGELDPAERAYLASFDRVFCIWPDHDGVMRRNLESAGARDILWADPMPPEGSSTHAVDHLSRQCRNQGLVLDGILPRLYPSERDRWWAERFMRVTGAGEKPALAVHPGSGSPRKNWPALNFVRVARDWLGRRAGHVLLVGGPADAEPLTRVRDALPLADVTVLRDESLPRVAAVLERCAAFVGNDSGVAHISAAVQTPTISVFVASDPAIWRPLGAKTYALGSGRDGKPVTASDVSASLAAAL